MVNYPAAKQKPRHVGRMADRGFQARRRVEHTGPNLAQAWQVLTGREDRPEREQLLADARAGASLRLHHTVLRARWGGVIVDRGDWRSQKNVGRRLAQQDQTSLP